MQLAGRAHHFLLLALLPLAPALAQAQVSPLPDSYLRPLAARSIGPANMSGRITGLAVLEKSPAVQYAAAASGGVWKTEDNARTWRPLFDDQPTAAIGAVAVAPSAPNVVWVGTGEANPRNSVSWGDGVYLSRDGGKTWKNVGLKESRHIGRIVVHPKDPDTAYVAALGRLWGPNKERGIFKTTDGGKSWQHVLDLGENVGCIDLVMAPDDPQTVYAAMYAVRRDWFSGPDPVVQFSPRAGLYRTRDGGKKWTKLTRGLPTRPMGRCGLDVWRKDPRKVFAVVQTDRTDVRVVAGQPASKGKGRLNIETGGIYRSDDGGDNWVKVNDLCPRPFYFGQVRVGPTDERRLWVLGIPLYVSADGGQTFRSDGAKGVHVDHHDLWINPANPKHMVLGTDGGVYHTTDGGAKWAHVRNLPIGQFYGIAVDTRKPYRVYGGLQDNGTWGGPSRTARPEGITLEDWKHIYGGDGFHCQVDPEDPDTVYAENQYGTPVRIDLRGNKRFPLRFKAPPGAPPYRFNWSTPLLLSPHNPKTLYMGGHRFYRSADRGRGWQAISPDLTRGTNNPFRFWANTLSAIAESPVQAGVLWAGSDDGLVHVSRNGGKTWSEVGAGIKGVPPSRHVSRIECSRFDAGTAYLSFDRHRQDDLAPYLFKTTDFGRTWRPIVKGLPKEWPIYVVRADPRNRNLLYVGTEQGLFLSFDGGANWQRFRNGLPTAPVHDLVVQARDRELVIGTHGRSIYVLDVAPLQDMNQKSLASPAYLFDIKPVVLFRELAPAPTVFAALNPPKGAAIYFALKEAPRKPARLTILDGAGKVIAELATVAVAGLHRAQWDLRRGGAPVPAGEHTARLEVGEVVLTKKFRVEAE
jgi:photosystem II stability/assembly factor-like uncharacterized protein